MKRISCMLLVLLMLATLAACGQETPESSASEGSSTVTTTTTTEEEDSSMNTTTEFTSATETIGGTSVSPSASTANTTNSKTSSTGKTSQTMSTTKTTVKKTADEILAQYTDSFLKCDKFALSKYMLPLWESDITFNEQVLPAENANGDILLSLSYTPLKIVSVRNNSLKKEYVEGKDYVLEGNKLRILKDGAIDWLPYTEMMSDSYTANKFVPRFVNDKLTDQFVRVDSESWFQSRYLHITYVHNEEWTGPVPEYLGDQLPKTMAKLKGKKDTSIVIYGDSICHGDGATSYLSLNPKMPVWGDLLERSLQSVYGNQVAVTNLSVGGWTSSNGVSGGMEVYQQVQVPGAKERVGSLKPDLVILGFGHNDGTTPNLTLANLEQIMADIRSVSPNTEFIVLGVLYQNPEFSVGDPSNPQRMCPLQRVYEVELKKAEQSGAVFVPLKAYEDMLLSKKPSWDFFCNNINHPNDFVYRLYAQILCQALVKEY